MSPTPAAPNPRAIPGHNRGPSLEPGHAFRKLCWQKARAGLLGNALPIEVIRMRVRRAAELGLDYRAYASVRAASGHDVVALLFSSNALHLLKGTGPAPERVARLESLVACGRIGLAVLPVTPERLQAAVPVLEAAHAAPPAFAHWRDARAALRTVCGRLPSDRVILIGETAEEAGWARAAALAGYLPGETYFARR